MYLPLAPLAVSPTSEVPQLTWVWKSFSRPYVYFVIQRLYVHLLEHSVYARLRLPRPRHTNGPYPTLPGFSAFAHVMLSLTITAGYGRHTL